jgi:hypothetical protein
MHDCLLKGRVNSYNLFKMKNNFTEVMSKKDGRRIQVVTRDRQKYQELKSAENEITFRNIDVSQFQEVIT